MSLRAVLGRVPLRALAASAAVPALPFRAVLQRPAQGIIRAISTTAPRLEDDNWYPAAQRRSGQPGTSLFVGNLPWRIMPEDVAAAFSQFGTVQDVRIPTDTQGRPRGFAHVEMADIESAKNLVESTRERPIFFGGRNARIEFAAGRYESAPEGPTTNIMIGDFDGDDISLQEIFNEYTRFISRIHVVRDRNTGESKRMAFVEFYDTEHANDAMNALNGLNLPYGGSLKLRFATPRRPYANTNTNTNSDN